MAESAVSTAAKWIGKLVEDVKYLDNVTENMKELQTELEWMLCFLQDADQQRYKKVIVQRWVSQTKDHAYEAEDLIEKYMLKVSRRTRDGSDKLFSMKTLVRYSCIIQDCFALRVVGSEMDALTLKITKLAERLQRYGVQINKGIEDLGEMTSAVNIQKKNFTQDSKETFIAIEDDIKSLVTYLTTGEKKVIAIVGMGGLGKTTIANQVYKHNDIKRHFAAFASVHISKKFRTENIMESILQGLTKEGDLDTNDEVDVHIKNKDFSAAVSKIMLTIRCLVVVDDVWSYDDFRKLRAVFPKWIDETSSRVLLTTRNEAVVEGLDDLVFTCKPKGIEKEEDRYKLFEIKFAGDLDGEKKNLAKEMLKHCGGVPLAISALAAILKRKQKIEEWEVVRNNIGFYLRSEEDPNNPYGNVNEVLETSYSDLPSHLKPCFLHMANYPEDYEIQIDELVRLWSSEGMITSSNNSVDWEYQRGDEEIAHICLDELAARSMIIVTERDSLGKIKTCQLHDLMRDVCMLEARKEGFLHQVDSIYVSTCETKTKLLTRRLNNAMLRRVAVHVDNDDDSPPLPQVNNIESLSSEGDESSPPIINNEDDDEPPETLTCSLSACLQRQCAVLGSLKNCPSSSSTSLAREQNPLISASGLRSLIFFSVGGIRKEEDCAPLVEKICECYPLLRVLDFKNNQIKEDMPKIVGRLIHLRYLGLYGTKISSLPKSIAKLKYMQTLDLRTQRDTVITLPNVLRKLKLLKHLLLPSFDGLGLSDLAGKDDLKYKIPGDKKLRLDGLTHLETLWNINLDRTDSRGLHDLIRIKSLIASSMTDKEALYPFVTSQTMRDMTLRMHPQLINQDSSSRLLSHSQIQVLHIHIPADDCFIPSLIPLCPTMFPHTLTHLRFWYIKFQADPMPALGQLKNLENLEFHICYGGGRLKCSEGSFPKLEFLLLGRFWNLEWDVEQGALPNIKRIHMYNTNFVTRLPETIPRSVYVTCAPCVRGIENQDQLCPHYVPS